MKKLSQNEPRQFTTALLAIAIVSVGGCTSNSETSGAKLAVDDPWLCSRASDCLDRDYCTDDACTHGECLHAPLCEPDAGEPDSYVPECTCDDDCDDHNDCTVDACKDDDLEVCSSEPLAEGKTCDGGFCDGTGVCVPECECADDCDDGLQCTHDVCNDGLCSHDERPVGVPCIGGLCNKNGECVQPECLMAAECDDSNECTADTCLLPEGLCQSNFLPNGAACDGGLCDGAGTCVPDDECGAVDSCNDNNECTLDFCTGRHICANIDLMPGSVCTGGVCNGNAECIVAPECGVDADCDDENDCTEDSCSAGLCTNTPTAPDSACGARNPGIPGQKSSP